METPFLELDLPSAGTGDVVDATVMQLGSGVLEIGVAVEISGSGDAGEDGIYLSRIATCFE